VNPYTYPKSLHLRTEHPPTYTGYRPYKPVLRKEFKKKCVYCRRPDCELHAEFGVDHYRPQSQFPALTASYLNLFYACNSCNRLKGKFWPTAAQLTAKKFIPNPCDHIMYQHLRYQGASAEAKSVAGKFTAILLDLNNPALVNFREASLVALAAIESKRREAMDVLDQLNKLRSSGKSTGPAIEAAIAQAKTDIQKLDLNLQTLTGE